MQPLPGLTVENLPSVFVASVIRARGPELGAAWLAQAVLIARGLCADWDLWPAGVLAGGGSALCIRCWDGRQDLVLKISPSAAEGRLELAALGLWAGNPRVPSPIHVDEASGSYTMWYRTAARRQPSTEEAWTLARSLHRRPADGLELPTLRANLDKRVESARERLGAAELGYIADLTDAERIIQKLIDTTGAQVTLHGDFQQRNFIVTATDLIAIDPELCVGDPLFDMALAAAAGTYGIEPASMLADVAALCTARQRRRLLAWTWSLCVLESHPGKAVPSPPRHAFINEFRGQVLAEAS